MESLPFWIGISVDSLDIVYTLLFGLIVFCFLAPTTEFISAGVTLENIFNKFLGNENLFFIQYHLRRTVLIRVVCSFIILIYFIFMQFLSSNVALAAPNFYQPFTMWDFILWIGFLTPSIICTHTYIVWYASGTWLGHPTIKGLREIVLANNNNNSLSFGDVDNQLKLLIASINMEYRSSDKFVASHGSLSSNWPGRRFIITNSWIIATYMTTFKIIQQSSTNLLAVVASALCVLDPNSLNQDGQLTGENLGTQTMVTVRFIRPDSGVCMLNFSLPASNLDDLHAKIQCPLIRAQGVVLEPTIIQQFIKVFTQVVDENEPVRIGANYELEQCIGCMTHQANVTLVRSCDSNSSMNSQSNQSISSSSSSLLSCGECKCRPMWCLECLIRWFASRQTNIKCPPSEWLSGRVSCPTCRTLFCARDVCRLVR